MITVTNWVLSRKRSAENTLQKIKIISGRRTTRYINIQDNVLAKLISKRNSPTALPTKRAKRDCIIKNTDPIELRISKFIPENGNVFTLREVFKIMDVEVINTNNFYHLVCTGKHNNTPKIGWCRMISYRRHNKYKKDGILPNETDYGVKMGAPQMIEDSKIALLNSTLSVANFLVWIMFTPAAELIWSKVSVCGVNFGLNPIHFSLKFSLEVNIV